MSRPILIIEDDATTQHLLLRTLERIGAAPEIVGNAEDALKLVNEKDYFLIIADINLPGLSGLELAKRVRQKEALTEKHTYIVALTGHVDEYSKTLCQEAGMDGYFTKPINRIKFQGFVQRLIQPKKEE